MAENSKIEWCDHTFNPWIGCTKVSAACFMKQMTKKATIPDDLLVRQIPAGATPMTSPLHDAAIEAGARFLCAEMSDDFREGAAYWKHVAQGFITALAANGLVVVKKEELDGYDRSQSAGRASVRRRRRSV